MLRTLDITLFKDAEIITMDKDNSIYDCMAVYNDTILDIGEYNNVIKNVNKTIKDIEEKENKKITFKEKILKGCCIVPGFIDGHLHPIIAIYFKTQIELSNIKSYSQLKDVLINEDKVREKDEWILGFDLMEDRFINEEERYFPNRTKLDEFGLNRPIAIFRSDGHICGVNSIALDLMGINQSNVKEMILTFGEIQIDRKGIPTGIFIEDAKNIILERIPVPSIERIKEAIQLFSDELASYGITSFGCFVQEGEKGFTGKIGRVEIQLLKYLIKENLIKQDFTIFLDTEKPKKLNRLNNTIIKLIGNNEKINVGGIKGFADGTFAAFTAYMYEPFSDSLEKKTGFLVKEKEDLFQLFKESFNLKYHLACHAIGDRANRIIVDVYKDIIKNDGNNPSLKNNNQPIRFRIEHASLINDETIKDAADLGIIIVSQPLFIDSDHTLLEKRLGPERIKNCYPFRSIIDSGIILAGASDAPAEPPDILKAIQICITRDGFVPEQAITVKEALKMFTYNAAYSLGQEKKKGSLEKGKLADFVILNRDITSISIDEITNTKILGTYHRGNKIYSKKNINE